MGRKAALLTWTSALFWAGCGEKVPIHPAILPEYQNRIAVGTFEPVDPMEHLELWHRSDWRFQLIKGLVDTSLTTRIISLRKADSLRPNEPLIPYYLALAYIEAGDSADIAAADDKIGDALVRDPGNGVLEVTQAYIHLQQGKLGRARSLFLDSRLPLRGRFHHARLEEILVGLFNSSELLNSYSLTEVAALYRRIPMPPIETMMDILYSVFLSPLPEHPYDIRIRGKDAALRLFNLGYRLRSQSRPASRLFNRDYENTAMGFVFQLKAAEFLTLFYRAFGDTAESRAVYNVTGDLNRKSQSFLETRPWTDSLVGDYLERWGNLIKENPMMPMGEALKKAEDWGLWRRLAAFRYPVRDDGVMSSGD